MARDLIQVKLDLAAKYDRLARLSRSKPKKRQFQHRADHYRRQAVQLQRA